jgi:hypothetical protein
MTTTNLRALLAVAALVGGCAAEEDSPRGMTEDLRPGMEDSSKEFKGTLSPHQAAFFEAMRNADDAALDDATAKLKADAERDRSDGFSAFLVGARAFVPSQAAVLRALMDGKPGSTGEEDMTADTVPMLKQAVDTLTDPLSLGFAAALLAATQWGSDPATAKKAQAIADANNVPGARFTELAGRVGRGDPAGGLAALTAMLDYCEGKAIDRANPDAEGYVTRANAGQLTHRNCSSGYLAPHATEGTLLIMGDLHWILDEQETAKRYYAALQNAKNYAWWPLRGVAERRLAGTQPVNPAELPGLVKCAACHVDKLAP